MNRYAMAVIVAFAAVPLAGCGSGAASPAVPSLSQAAGATGSALAAGSGASRAAALHAAAQCIRQHGITSYQDPVLTPSGQVYSDSRSIDDAGRATVDAVQHACASLLAQANLSPDNEPSAPPQLVQAGVRSAECLRANGMPNVTDPTAQSNYTPGHGFGFTANEVPAGGKASPIFQHAAHACRSVLDAEIRASTLASLGNDG